MMQIVKKNKKALNKVVKILKSGGVIICPTDTVYGFLADAGNKKAVENIYKIKKRTRSKPLPVFVRDIKMAKQIAEIDARQEKILRKYWPGKYTFVFCRKNYGKISLSNSIELESRVKEVGIGKLYGVEKNTIAIRIPKYKFLNNLLKKINRPLAQTSVNISGEPPLTKIENIKARFTQNCGRPGLPQFLLLVVDGGDLKGAKPSKIVDLTTDKKIIVRA